MLASCINESTEIAKLPLMKVCFHGASVLKARKGRANPDDGEVRQASGGEIHAWFFVVDSQCTRAGQPERTFRFQADITCSLQDCSSLRCCLCFIAVKGLPPCAPTSFELMIVRNDPHLYFQPPRPSFAADGYETGLISWHRL